MADDAVTESPASRFTSETARVVRTEAIERKRKDAEERRAAALLEKALGTKLLEHNDDLDLGDVMKGAAKRIALKLLNGSIPIRNGSDAAAAIKALMEAGRLEKGEATSSVDHTTPDERKERMKELRSELDRREAEAEAGNVTHLHGS